jgi:hypothetical protein
MSWRPGFLGRAPQCNAAGKTEHQREEKGAKKEKTDLKCPDGEKIVIALKERRVLSGQAGVQSKHS